MRCRSLVQLWWWSMWPDRLARLRTIASPRQVEKRRGGRSSNRRGSHNTVHSPTPPRSGSPLLPGHAGREARPRAGRGWGVALGGGGWSSTTMNWRPRAARSQRVSMPTRRPSTAVIDESRLGVLPSCSTRRSCSAPRPYPDGWPVPPRMGARAKAACIPRCRPRAGPCRRQWRCRGDPWPSLVVTFPCTSTFETLLHLSPTPQEIALAMPKCLGDKGPWRPGPRTSRPAGVPLCCAPAGRRRATTRQRLLLDPSIAHRERPMVSLSHSFEDRANSASPTAIGSRHKRQAGSPRASVGRSSDAMLSAMFPAQRR